MLKNCSAIAHKIMTLEHTYMDWNNIIEGIVEVVRPGVFLSAAYMNFVLFPA